MKVLYFDCTNGISGDMLLNALMELGECRTEVEAAIEAETFSHEHHTHSEESAHHHTHEHSHHGRSYHEVKQLIAHSGFSAKAKEYAAAIYRNIAVAEAEVHGESLETIHFHEVGRDQAVKNALGIGMAMEKLAPDKTVVSPIYDGKGTVVCSHGEIPVPVPAVRALMKRSTFTFRQAEVEMEMVTPSGLAGLMGIGAQPADSGDTAAEQQYKPEPEMIEHGAIEHETLKPGTIIKETEVHGARATGRGGLKAYLLQVNGEKISKFRYL